MTEEYEPRCCQDCDHEFDMDNPRCNIKVESKNTNDFACESCTDCCEGHCIECGINGSPNCGGRYTSGDEWNLEACDLCDNFFHSSPGLCNEGGFCCIRCNTTFCAICKPPQCRVKRNGIKCKTTKCYDNKR